MRRDNPWLWVGVTALILVVLLPFVIWGMAWVMGPGGMMSWGNYGSAASLGWPWWLAMGVGMLMMVLFWGGLIVGGYFLVRALAESGNRGAAIPSETPLDILKRRYASGEISGEEYNRMRQQLER